MLKTSAMASCKNPEGKRKHKDVVVNNLKDLFGNVLHIDIIKSVASQCNFDIQKSSNLLLEMTNNIGDQPFKKKEKNKGGAKRGQDLFVITGRGKNSEGGRSKIKPAVISRLKKRKISFVQMNPGLLKIRVLKNSSVTSDI